MSVTLLDLVPHLADCYGKVLSRSERHIIIYSWGRQRARENAGEE